MDSGQAKQPGASRTPGGLHLFSVHTLASFMFKHDMSSHVPICQRYQTTRALTQHHGMLHISNKNQTNNYLTVCIGVLCGVYLCAMGECVFMHEKGHRLRIYGSAYRRWKPRPLRVQMRRYPPFLHIYVRHYLICWSASSKGECVCASSGCSRLVTQCGADCVGRCCFMCQAHFYRRLVVYTSHIKLAVQSCLKKVKRGACGVISLCISPIIEPLSFPAKTNAKATFQWR